MPSYTQANRPMEVITPLGKDVLLLIGFTGHEAISQLFNFQMEMVAENKTDIPFDKLLGQKITMRLELPGGKNRYLNGLCLRVSQGRRDQVFTHYKMEIVPQLWTLTKKAEIRTFQHIAIPDILKKMLAGIDTSFEIQGTFQPRDYVVQYRETDFNFVSRLMEEEGIYYFFKHTADGHKMVVANTPQSHPDLPERSKLIYEETVGGKREEDRVLAWEKVQELRTSSYMLWDHCFELPYKSLKAQNLVQETVQVGKVTHKLKYGGNEQMAMRDYPGEYAGRFDGVNKGGGPQPAELQKIFQDNARTVGVRMQQEAVQAMTIQGISTVRHIVSGHKFSLERHFNADGQYVVTSVQHDATFTGDYRGGETGEYLYENSFTSIPMALPFRPPRVTPKPTVEGTHTAVVVGPVGQEIFTDKYGRVKVQFNWDKEGSHNADSSCWVRVTQPWAGKRWGMYHIPRIGQEVIVDFLEGDADNPIITGTVFNADQMPQYLGQGLDPKHPHNPNLSGIKTCSTPGGDGYNELRFDDTKSKEQVFHHCERNQDTRVKNNSMENVNNDKHMIVGGKQGGGNLREKVMQNKHQKVDGSHFEKIAKDLQKLVQGNHDQVVKKNQKKRVEQNKDEHIKGNYHLQVDGTEDIIIGGDKKELLKSDEHHHVNGDRKSQVDGDQDLTVQGDQKELIQGNYHLHINGDQKAKVDGKQSLTVTKDLEEKVGQNYAMDTAKEIHLKGGQQIILEAGQRLTIKGPGGFVDIGPGGVTIQGTLVKINSGGSAGTGKPANPDSPDDAKAPKDAEPPAEAVEANPDDPTPADDSVTGNISPTAGVFGQPTQ